MIAFAHYLSRPYVLVLLAGALHPSPLRRQLDVPVLALPLGRDRTMLDAWLDTVANTSAPIARLIIVVNSPKDAQTMRSLTEERSSAARPHTDSTSACRHSPSALPDCEVEVMIDPAQWRGPAGLLRDIATSPGGRAARSRNGRLERDCFEPHTLFACVEAAVVPPRTLDPLIVRRADPTIAGAIGAAYTNDDLVSVRNGTSERLRPAGAYAFTVEAITSIPPIGFHDIKEQLLPSLYRAGKRVPVVPLCREVVRVRDLDSYLAGVRRSLGHKFAISCSPAAHMSPSAVLSGACVVQDEVVVEDGAVIHDSVVMRGAKIGGGSIVARSVIGPNAVIGPRSVVRSAVVAPAPRPIPRWSRSRRFVNRTFPLRAIAPYGSPR